MNNENKDFFINDFEAENITLEEKKSSKSKVLYEDISKREKNIKHFRLQNGNFMAVMYDHPVHKLDPETNKYVDISSELKETDLGYEAVRDKFKVRMPKTEGNDHFVTMEKDGKEISWEFVPKNASRRKKSVAVFSRKPKQEPWDIDEYPCVKYEKSDTNIDLQYDISEDGVKESIILNKHPNCNSFTFKIKFKGLTPVLSEDKKTVLIFSDEGIGSELPEMRIPPAFMEDANESFCDDIHYEIRQTENETFLDLVLDSDWLSEPERVYPVVIDPHVELAGHGTSKLKMVEIKSQGASVSSTNSSPGRRIGIDSNGIIHRLYVEFVLPELADGYDITKAGFVFRQKSYRNDTGCSDSYTIAPVSDPNGKKLSVSSFTWENVQSLVMGNTIDTLNGESRYITNDIEIDLTKTVEQWYKNSNSSTCLVIKKSNETPCCCNNTVKASCLDLYSTYASSKEYRPRLYIEYKNADTYSDHQKYHTFEVGRAGTGSINLFSGRMSFAHGDVSAEGVRLPLSVSHLYRHEYVNEQEDEINKYGKGWKLSVEQTLDIIDDHGIKAVYTNAQGKRHYFMYDETNASGDITDDAGLGLTYKEECNCICGKATTHVLTDEKGNKMTFNSNGKLIQLIDTNGNVSCLNYSNGNLTSVVDGSGHSANLYYDSNNKLIRIEDNNGYKLCYSYEPTGELSKIKYPLAENAYIGENEPTTSFFYDNNNRLEKITDNTGISYSIVYEDDKVKSLRRSGTKRVCDKTTIDSTEIFDDSISFEYRAKSTAIVSDRLGIKTVYKFDSNGREMSSYQDMTEAVDQSKISESTITEISGYKSIVDTLTTSRIGKYRSLSVSMCNDASNEVNLIQNGFFNELNSSSKPTHWSAVGSGSISSVSYIDGKKSYYFSSAHKSKYISQTVDLCNCNLNGNVLVASAWAKSSGSATANTDTSTAKFRMCLKVKYEGGEVEEYFENYDTGYSGWQYAAIPFVLKKECCPIEVTVKLDYSYNSGYCYFTNARLVAVEGISTTNTYKTDETPIDSINVFGECKDIKMTTTTKDSVLTTIDYMDDDSDIVRNTIIDRAGRSYTTDYKYDSKHNLVKMQDYRGIVIDYTYNKYGKELTRKTYHKDNPNMYMFSENTYEDDNFLKSERDPRYSHNGEELKTTYTHDKSRGLLLKQTAVNGQEYNYSYDNKTDDLISLSSTTDNNTNENQFFYTCGYLTRVAHNGFNFGFSYDELGRSKTVSVGGNVLSPLQTMFYSKNGANDIIETVFGAISDGNVNEKNTVTTDIFGNPILSTYTDKNNVTRDISTAEYDSVGKIKKLVDKERRICYNYTYDAKGNVTKIEECDELSGEVLTTNTFVFDANERLTSKTYGAVGHTYRPIYEKNASGYIYPDNEVMGITLDGKFTDKVTKDGLRRVSAKTFAIGNSTLFEDTYGYLSTPKDSKTIATEIVSSVSSHVYGTSANFETLNYTYDKAGNLETVKRGSELISKYYYDGLNRLKREDNYSANKTYIWSYDVGGNILFKKEYALCADVNLGECLDTKSYTYANSGWKDQLLSYNGLSCEYDEMGNPTTYLGKTLVWTKVRRLASYDNGAVTFDYGANGIRYRKNNTVYTLDGNKILRESDGTKTLTYYHGGSGIVGFEYNGTDYYFRKNLQGDVTEIYTSAGLKVASYAYDAWGKVLAVNNYTDGNIGDINPIRYRSYYYDVETGLYYLNSRYYDPETGRFINADTTDVLEDAMYDINGMNLYVYCDNNPVMDRDDGGDKGFFKKLIKAVAVVAVVAVTAAVVCAAAGITTPLCAAATVVACAAKGAVVGAAVGAATGAVVGGVQGAVEGYKETGNLDGTLRGMIKGAGKGAVEGAQDGMISGMISGAFSGAASSMMGNPMFCFVAGTTVLTTLGKKAIETIQVGDTIPCVDHITGEAAEKKVISTTVNKVNRLIELDIDGEIIQCTETHPFQVKGRGWVNAEELTPNDIVYTKDWNTVTVKSVKLLELDEPVEVFNFEVEDCHTYFVGELGVLAHNSCRGNAVKKAWKNEVNNVKNGGNGITRQWSTAEKTELLTKGKVKGYVGHHMKSVSGYPELAGSADNIQFLTRAEHFRAHNFNWRTVTHGFFQYWKS